ncbi:hypothetical protein IWX65_001227 [Arthrobacter sp. CAN_A214]|uniref:helicase-associated domain-containing protein n=1 Tax=Arthrobacter sp. CAN_A214 TaxID=2787720 RepID=UPI0018C962B4
MSAIRALAEQLASRTDSELRKLLSARPDLILPPVPDFPALAARASTRGSLQRALENIAVPQQQVLEAVLVVEDPAAPETGIGLAQLKDAFGEADADTLRTIADQLCDLALLYRSAGDPATYLPVGSLGDALGPYPAGLGRPLKSLARSIPTYGPRLIEAVSVVGRTPGEREPAGPVHMPASAAEALEKVISSPSAWAALMASAPEGTLAVLERLAASPVGATPEGRGGDTSSPVPWLLHRALLAPLDAKHVELPRAVGQAVRGHTVFPVLGATPPEGNRLVIRGALRDNAAFSAVAELLRGLSALLAAASTTPVATLRSGGVGVRELRRLTESLQCETRDTPWLLELAAAAGLLTLDVDDSRWKPSETAWDSRSRHEQWLILLRGWLELDRAPSLTGSKLADGSAINALAAEGSRPDAPLVRRRLLTAAVELAGRPAGEEPDVAQSLPTAGFAVQDLVEWLSWHQPRLRRRFERLVPGMLTEAAALGLFGGGALTPIGFLVEQGLLDDAAAAVGVALPAPVSRVVLQADLTAIAPGYLEPAVARELLVLSTPEGQGPASTYRFSADSIRRALDAGHDAASITAFLTEHSATEVPQALTYLVEDTAGRYGSLRVGRAASYVRTEDDAVVAALLADPRAAALGLVQLAPTVIASPASPAELTSLLRDLGYAPAPEVRPGTPGRGTRRSPDGPHPDDAASAVPPPPQSPSSSSSASIAASRARLNPWSLSEEEIEAQLASLRLRGTGRVDRSPGQGQESEVLLGLETLRTAIRRKVPVRLGTADSQGNSVRQILVPLSVSGGRVRVYDPQKQVEKVVSVHRVMDVEIVEGTPTDD